MNLVWLLQVGCAESLTFPEFLVDLVVFFAKLVSCFFASVPHLFIVPSNLFVLVFICGIWLLNSWLAFARRSIGLWRIRLLAL